MEQTAENNETHDSNCVCPDCKRDETLARMLLDALLIPPEHDCEVEGCEESALVRSILHEDENQDSGKKDPAL